MILEWIPPVSWGTLAYFMKVKGIQTFASFLMFVRQSESMKQKVLKVPTVPTSQSQSVVASMIAFRIFHGEAFR